MSDGYSIFVSYAHEDEPFKNALRQQLKGLERSGAITAWDDRCIDGGDDWRREIFKALDGCRLALLLVSPAFIASDFIYTQELNRLLERRQRDGIRVVPLIVRPCGWKHEAPLESLQALPRDGKPIISFSKDDGARDQAWADIVDAIARWAKSPAAAAPPTPAASTQSAAALIARLGEQIAAGNCPELDAASRQQLLGHAPANLDQYRIARWAEWSQPRYAVDKRFTRLALLVDQGPQAQGQRWQEQQREFQDLREVLNEVEDTALVLLGPPGCGKSTLLRRLELDLAADALADTEHARISLFLPLNRYRPAHAGAALPAPQDWIAQEWQRPQHQRLPPFADLLRTGRLVLLLDAINEMPHASDADYLQRIDSWSAFIAELARDAPGTRVVFSCRSLDYSAYLSSPQQSVPHVNIKALSDVKVQDFLRQYSPEHGAALWRQLAGTPQLDVFRSPFYLKLLVQYQGAEFALKSGRAALFTAFARGALAREIEARNPLFSPGALLVRRDYERSVRGDWAGAYELAANSPLFQALAELALRMQERCAAGGEARIRVKYAEALALVARPDADALLEAGAALQVLDIARDEVLFMHQLVQEYFAARALAATPQPERARVTWRADQMSPSLEEVLAGLADSEPLPAAPGTGWEESFMLAAAMAPDSSAFVHALIPINLPLAGRCAAQPDVALAEPLRRRLQHLLVERSREPAADLRARIAAARALGELGDPRFERRPGKFGTYLLPPLVTIAAGDYPMGSGEGIEADEAPA
ncbi:MAG: TIR domain-containing protein, partial [Rhodocyclaceae bacterium]|nr:TIR domain-containing protein [Rhodocyclaceae bacterium]